MRPVKQRLRAARRDVPHRQVDAAARRDRRQALLEAEQELADADLGALEQAAPVPKILGYTQAGPVRANPDYAGKSDLERAAQLMRDLDLEPGARRGDTRVLRASPPPRRRR
jgi:hypothetical protein